MVPLASTKGFRKILSSVQTIFIVRSLKTRLIFLQTISPTLFLSTLLWPNGPVIKIDPFEKARKNAHIWRGEECLIWYNERIDDSFTLLVLYDFGDKKRRLFLDVDKAGQKTEFKNEEIHEELFKKLEIEVEMVQKLISGGLS